MNAERQRHSDMHPHVEGSRPPESDLTASLDQLAAGRPVVLLDEEHDSADLVLSAERITTTDLAFLIRHSSGLVCAVLSEQRADDLDLPPMVPAKKHDGTAEVFAVAVDAASDITTGISARDRAVTLRTLATPETRPSDLRRPGHVMPLRVHSDGVLGHRGRAEAALDLCYLAGLEPVGAISELMEDSGERSTTSSAIEFARRHDLTVISIGRIVAHRRQNEPQVERLSSAVIPTRFGEFTAVVFGDRDGTEHLAMVAGNPHLSGSADDAAPLVRVHSECLTGDLIGSRRCDCGPQLDDALQAIAAEGRGVLVYTRGHEGRGIGLSAKIAAYRLQDEGRDTVDANVELGLPVDAREYWHAAGVLHALGVSTVRLITNNPEKMGALEAFGVTVTERVTRPVHVNRHNAHYLHTKAVRMGHALEYGNAQASSAI